MPRNDSIPDGHTEHDLVVLGDEAQTFQFKTLLATNSTTGAVAIRIDVPSTSMILARDSLRTLIAMLQDAERRLQDRVAAGEGKLMRLTLRERLYGLACLAVIAGSAVALIALRVLIGGGG